MGVGKCDILERKGGGLRILWIFYVCSFHKLFYYLRLFALFVCNSKLNKFPTEKDR